MEARLVFYKGRRGDIISRLPNGKIVLVNRRAERIPKPGEKWVCRIDFEKPKFAVVTPIQRIVKKPVYKVIQYACGHSKKIRLYDKEMPENEEPEIRVTKSPNVCEKCKDNCKHLETEWDTSISIFYFEIRRICKKCRKTVDSYDFSNLIDENRGFFVADFEKIREAIRQRISDSEGQQIALRVLDDMEQYVREYKEYSKREKELKKAVFGLRAEILRLIGMSNKEIAEFPYIGDYEINKEQSTVWYWTSVKGESDELYTPVRHHIKIPEGVRERVYDIWNRVQELEKELREVENWLIENRPVE